MKLELTFGDIIKDLKEYTDLMEYLAFFREYVMDVYNIDPHEDFGLDAAYTEKYGKEPPKED